uniref:Protein FAM210B n=1 Tax=Phallusia mammillata TaxID=59560 RepID=A0A6F9DD95_9ASCI|nr:protein FAM210B [Phallusia mammillata]
MKTLRTLKLMQNCCYNKLAVSSFRKTARPIPLGLFARSVTTTGTIFDNFHPYNPSYYYDQNSECSTVDKRTTYADLSPCEVNRSAVQLLFAGISNESFVATNARTEKNVHHRLSDDFWNSSPLSLSGNCLTKTGTRSYSTNSDKPTSNQQKSSEKAEETKSESKDENIDTEHDLGQKTKREQLKIIFAQYGAFGVAFHIVMSLCSLGFFYLLVSSGIDVVGLLAKVGIELSGIVSGASTFVIAYAVHKIAMPVRVSITVVSVPILVRYLRRIGLFKK